VHYHPFHRAVHKPQGIVHFRQLFQPRSLVVALPLLACLLFSSLYGLPHALSVSQHSAAASHATSSSTTHATSGPSTKNDSNLPNSASPSNSSATAPTISTSPAKPTSSAPAVTAPLPSCDQATQAAAITTKQIALNAENTRHSATLALLGATDDVANLLLPQATQLKVATESALHITTLQQIQATYQASVTAAHC
jgi:hypothetical protein